MAKEPNYSREELIDIVKTWDEGVALSEPLEKSGKEYTIYESDIRKLGIIPAAIISDLSFVFEKEWARQNLEFIIDDYSVTWVHLDMEYFVNKYSEFTPDEVHHAIATLIYKGELALIKDDFSSINSYSGWYATMREVMISNAVKKIESLTNDPKNKEDAMFEAMKEFYPSVYEEMQEADND